MGQVNINGAATEVDAPEDTPLLWALRDHLGLCGTKFGCGIGACGACTVHIDGQAVKSCIKPLRGLGTAAVVTIEGLGTPAQLHPVQQAWLDEGVSQCGFCQPGQIMAAAALLQRNANPSDLEIDRAMNANLCRCGTYPRIRKAVKRAAAAMGGGQ